jgi:hypothetical protein
LRVKSSDFFSSLITQSTFGTSLFHSPLPYNLVIARLNDTMSDSINNLFAKMWPSDEPAPTNPPHPHYPLGVEIAGYIANDMSVPMLLACFSAGVAAIWSGAYLIVKKYRPTLSTGELLTFLWFVLCMWERWS